MFSELKLKLLFNRINHKCCEHRLSRNAYYVGYVGIKICRVAFCLDCGEVQYIGNAFGKILYPLVRRFVRNRMEILHTVEIDNIQEEKECIEPIAIDA